MVRNKGDKNFTDSERSLLITLIRDYYACDLSDATIIDILSNRLGRKIKETSYYMLKNEANKGRLTPQEWLDNFVRFGIVDFYNKRIQEVKMVQKELIKLYAQEANKKEDPKDKNKQNKQLMQQLAKTINDSSKMLSEMAMGPPYLAKLYSLIPQKLLKGEDLEFVQKHFENMNKDQKKLWSLDSDDSEEKENTEKLDDRPDPSKAPTALLPPIDNLDKSYKNKQSLNYGLSSEDEDEQRVF